MWRSLVARMNGVHEAGSSSLLTQTSKKMHIDMVCILFYKSTHTCHKHFFATPRTKILTAHNISHQRCGYGSSDFCAWGDAPTALRFCTSTWCAFCFTKAHIHVISIFLLLRLLTPKNSFHEGCFSTLFSIVTHFSGTPIFLYPTLSKGYAHKWKMKSLSGLITKTLS